MRRTLMALDVDSTSYSPPSIFHHGLYYESIMDKLPAILSIFLEWNYFSKTVIWSPIVFGGAYGDDITE